MYGRIRVRKLASFRGKGECTNETSILVHQTHKHGEMAFLTSKSASKHDIFALGVDPTARDVSKGGDSDLVSQATPFAVLDK